MVDAMTDDETEEVQPSPWFFTWMKEFSLGDAGAVMTQRWQAVEKFAEGADGSDVEALVRLALASKHPASSDRAKALEQAFRDEGQNFTAKDNARELQVLAACCLIKIAEDTDNDSAVTAALAMATASIAGLRRLTLPVDLLQAATAALGELVCGTARRPEIPAAGVPYKPLFESSVQKAKAQPDMNGLIEGLTQAGNAVTAAVNQNQAKTQKAISALTKRLDQQDEELQMLWWLIGERSEDLNCSFAAIPELARPLVLSKELADHTLLPPGPPSVHALLSRAKLSGNGKVVLADAVAAAPYDWLKTHAVAQEASPVTQPLHFAILRQLETGPGKDWVAGWAAATDLPKDVALAPLTLAELFYRERLLTRLFG